MRERGGRARRVSRTITLLSLAVLLASCSAAHEARLADEATACRPEIVDQEITDDAGREIGLVSLVAAARRADYVLIGEVHTDAHHHAAKLKILKPIVAQGGQRSLLLEMLDPSHDPILEAYVERGMPSAELEARLRWGERGWPLWDAYFALIEEARRHRVTIRGANIPGDLIPYVTLYGGLAFPRRLRREIGLDADAPFLVDRSALREIVGAAHGSDEAATERLVVAQYAKDAFMAHRLVEAGRGSVLIAGNNHVQDSIGIPAHILRRDPTAEILSIGMVTVNDAALSVASFFETTRPDHRAYDMITFIRRRCVA